MECIYVRIDGSSVENYPDYRLYIWRRGEGEVNKAIIR